MSWRQSDDPVNGAVKVAKTTIGFGVALVITGLVAYGLTQASVTALIPAFMGGIVLLLGLVAQARPAAAGGLVAAALVIALLAVFGSFSGIRGVLAMVAGNPVERPVAAMAQTVTLLLSVAYLVVAGRAWLGSRKAGVAAAA
jgi:hypothetical protein